MREAPIEEMGGLNVGGHDITNLRYAEVHSPDSQLPRKSGERCREIGWAEIECQKDQTNEHRQNTERPDNNRWRSTGKCRSLQIPWLHKII